MINKYRLSALALSAALLGGTAFAAQSAEQGLYAGVGAGQSHVDKRGYDDEDTAFSAFGGYQFNRYFGLEAGYADFGKLESRGDGERLDASSAYLAAVGTLPFTDRFSGYARAGIQRWDLDRALPALTGSNDDNGNDPLYGVGLQYRFNDQVALRGEYTRFEIKDADLDLAQLQVRFDF